MLQSINRPLDQLGRIELTPRHQKTGADREGQHHDEPEQHLAHGFAGIDIAVDQVWAGRNIDAGPRLRAAI
jgi:hypothetical protein